MSNLVKRLRIKAGMIEMGELIAWGSDSALMREAADALEIAGPAVQAEPVAEVVWPDEVGRRGGFRQLGHSSSPRLPAGTKLYIHPQPAEQQPVVSLPAVAEQVTEVEAPSNSLPSWSECNLRVGNSEWLKDNGIEAECDSLTANPLHEFIYEYDDSDAYKSAWFLHRLEKLIDFIRSEQQSDVAQLAELLEDVYGTLERAVSPADEAPEAVIESAMAVIDAIAQLATYHKQGGDT